MVTQSHAVGVAIPWRFLTLLSAANVALLAFKIGEQSLWLDENMSVVVAQSSWEGVWRFFLLIPEQHPLYYLLLRAWTVFGTSEAAVRSFSALFVVASLWVLYPLARRLVDERVAKLSCVLLCFSPFYLYFGQEARMYSMLGFLTILGSLLFLRCLDNPSRRAIVGYTLVAVLGAYTHLYFLFAVAAHFIYLVVRHRSQRAVFRRVFAAQAIAAASYLPWGILMVSHSTSVPWWKGPENVIFGIPYTLLRFSVGYSYFPANYQWKERLQELVLSNWMVLSVAALACAVLGVLGLRYVFRQRASGLFVALGLAVPMIIALTLSLVIIIIGERYLVVSFPFYVIVLASGIAALWERQRRIDLAGRILVVAYGAVVAGSLYNHYFDAEFGKEQWADVAALIGASASPSDLIVLRRGFIESPFLRYYRPPAGQQIRKSEELALDSLRTARRVWLVLAHAPDADAYASQIAPTHPIEKTWLFPHQSGIRVLLMARRDPSSGR